MYTLRLWKPVVLLKVTALLLSGLLPMPPTRGRFHMVKATCLVVEFWALLPHVLSLIPTSSRSSVRLGRTFATTVAKSRLTKSHPSRDWGVESAGYVGREVFAEVLVGTSLNWVFTRGPPQLLPCTLTCAMLSNTQPLFLCNNAYQLLLK